MDTVSLDVQPRDLTRKATDLLRADLLPLEYYGRGIENRSFQVDYQTFRKLLRKAGTNSIIELSVDGKEKMNVLVHDLQRDPVTDNITHVDLINVRMDEEIHTQVMVELTGTAPAVKDLGGVLMHHLDSIDVKCMPKDLVHSITVSVESIVDFHSPIRVRDLQIPATITVLSDPDDIVATAVAPRVEEEETPAAATEGAEGAEGVAAATGEAQGEEKAQEGGAKGAKGE